MEKWSIVLLAISNCSINSQHIVKGHLQPQYAKDFNVIEHYFD